MPDAILDSLGLPNSVARVRNDSEEVEGDARRIFDIARANTRRAHKMGVGIVCGTDSGGPGGLHGAGVPREIEIINECGLTPMQSIQAAEKLHGLVPASFETYQIVDPGDIVIRPTDLQIH